MVGVATFGCQDIIVVVASLSCKRIMGTREASNMSFLVDATARYAKEPLLSVRR